MSRQNKFRRIGVPLLLVALMIPVVLAEDNPPARPFGPPPLGAGPGPGGFAEIMSRAMREELGVTDDQEWKVIQPKLDAVTEKRMKASGMGMLGGLGLGVGLPGAENNAKRSPMEQASQDLRKLLDNKGASADEIAPKLAALRAAQEKARAELLAAQKELVEVLTVRQEAVLVMKKMLD